MRKTQLMLLDTPIIISDEIIQKGDWMRYAGNGSIEQCTESDTNWKDEFGWAKVIAGLPQLPAINFNGFQEELGIDKEDKMIRTSQLYAIDKAQDNMGSLTKLKLAWEDGFRTSERLNDKTYTLQDMMDAFVEGFHYTPNSELLDEAGRDFALSLIPRTIDVTVAPEWSGHCNCICHNEGANVRHVVACCHPTFRIKITEIL